MFDGLWQGIFGFAGAEASASASISAAIIQASATKEAAMLQHLASMAQIKAQVDANAKEQAFNKQESELAFSRNSSLGQLNQLMAAGLSEFQARQVLAANGSSGTFTASPAVNQMQGVDLTAPANALASGITGAANAEAQGVLGQGNAYANMLYTAGSALGQISNSLLESFTDPHGGSLGAFGAKDALEFVTLHINDLVDTSVHNFKDLKGWIKSLDPKSEVGKTWQDFLKSSAYRKVETFFPATLSFNNNFNSVYSSSLDSKQAFDASISTVKLTNAQTLLTQVSQSYQEQATKQMTEQISLTAEQRELYIQQQESERIAQRNYLANAISTELENKLFEKEMPYIASADIAQFTASAAEAAAHCQKWNDKFYVEQWLRAEMATEEGRAMVAILAHHKAITADNAINQFPNLSAFAAVMNIWNSAGIDIHGTARTVVDSYRGWKAAKKIVATMPK